MLKVEVFTKGKTEERNEDCFGYTDESFVIADGCTDKSGRTYGGKTGGEIVSRLVVQEALSSRLNGTDIIDFLNAKVFELYQKFGIVHDIDDAKYRFTCGCIIVRFFDERIMFTYLGDLGFRINGSTVYRNIKQVDTINAEERSRYIGATKDVAGGREHIMPLLLQQFNYQNNGEQSLGYGVVDGTSTPSKFVKTFEYPKDAVHVIELFTDGYFDIPSGSTILEWEKSFRRVEKQDPDKWKMYKSTKSNDDRTIAIITF